MLLLQSSTVNRIILPKREGLNFPQNSFLSFIVLFIGIQQNISFGGKKRKCVAKND